MEILRVTGYDETAVLSLYESVGWTSYTAKPEMLKKAFECSLLILGAYENNKLVGMIRLVGDGASIIYVQDLLVHPDFQCKGIGSALLRAALVGYPDVYQTSLMTDASEKTLAFYRKNGFLPVSEIGVCGFMKINR